VTEVRLEYGLLYIVGAFGMVLALAAVGKAIASSISGDFSLLPAPFIIYLGTQMVFHTYRRLTGGVFRERNLLFLP
jgi:hypothetical protein